MGKIHLKFRESVLYNLNNPKLIKKILFIPKSESFKNFYRNVDNYYDVYYLEKKEVKKLDAKERKDNDIRITKNDSVLLSEPPKTGKYRKVVNSNVSWLKPSQRKLNKILTKILLSEKIRGEKQESIIPYLHSSVKMRSYATNAKAHLGPRYLLSIDIENFYPSISKIKVYNFFKDSLCLDSDIAMFYTLLSTIKEDDEYVLGQGLPQSSTLAYLVNYSMFNYLYEYSKDNGIDMTVYVDDIVFSSGKEISQDFIDRLFGFFRGNNLFLNKSKIHLSYEDSVKKVTGVYIENNKTSVSNRKHEEVHNQYNYLLETINNMCTLNDYFEIYNIYLRFYGNCLHIIQVEDKLGKQFQWLIDEFDFYFPKGIHKKEKRNCYNLQNIKNTTDLNKLNAFYQKLLFYKNNIDFNYIK